jgi:hypothetical protein
MDGDNRVIRVVGWAALFFAATLLLDIAIGAIGGSPVSVPERAIFWATVSPFWSIAMEWHRGKQQPVRG